MIDLEARLAPFFPPPVAHLSDQNGHGPAERVDDMRLANTEEGPASGRPLCAGV